MFKKVPQDQVTQRVFKVFKNITLTEDDVTVFDIRDHEGPFDAETDEKSNGFSERALYNSLKHKYYNKSASLFEYGGGFSTQQQYAGDPPEIMRVISFPHILVGEAIAEGSFILEDSGSGLTVVDDGSMNIISQEPEYNYNSFDIGTGIMTLSNSGSTQLVFESIDFNTGEAVVSLDGVAESPNPTILNLDFANTASGEIKFEAPLNILAETQEVTVNYGNLFPQQGNLIMSVDASGDNVLENFEIKFKSTKTLSETEVLCEVNAGEFNVSTNPTAVDYENFTSYDFETTTYDERGNRLVEKIINFTPRKKSYIYSSYDSTVSGSFDDYYDNGSSDPTGSYLTTYVTSVGLYDDNSELLAIAKMAKPVKLLPNHPINFLIRLDT